MHERKLFLKTYLRLTTLQEFDKCSLHIFFFCLNKNETEAALVVDDDN